MNPEGDDFCTRNRLAIQFGQQRVGGWTARAPFRSEKLDYHWRAGSCRRRISAFSRYHQSRSNQGNENEDIANHANKTRSKPQSFTGFAPLPITAAGLCYTRAMKRNVGILVFDDVEELDFVGPLEVFGMAER